MSEQKVFKDRYKIRKYEKGVCSWLRCEKVAVYSFSYQHKSLDNGKHSFTKGRRDYCIEHANRHIKKDGVFPFLPLPLSIKPQESPE